MLEIKDLKVAYGRVRAVKGISFTVEEGQEVAEGDTIVVIEAMKMEQPLKAHKAGTVTSLAAEVGATVTNGAVICELKD